jgi:hypothetical protein
VVDLLVAHGQLITKKTSAGAKNRSSTQQTGTLCFSCPTVQLLQDRRLLNGVSGEQALLQGL